MLNAETLAQLALLARFGPQWFREQGTPSDPGTFLTTVTGSTAVGADPARRARGGPRHVAPRRCCRRPAYDLERVQAVLVGGYHGAWVPAHALDVGLTRDELSAYAATPGAGVLHVLDRDACPLALRARIAALPRRRRARGSAAPASTGCPGWPSRCRRWPSPAPRAGLEAEVARLAALVDGRGACAHPDGTVRFVGSTLRTFADHVEDHFGGTCHARAR